MGLPGHSQVRCILLADIFLQDAGVDVGWLQGTIDVMACREATAGQAPWGPQSHLPAPQGPLLSTTRPLQDSQWHPSPKRATGQPQGVHLETEKSFLPHNSFSDRWPAQPGVESEMQALSPVFECQEEQ